MPYSSKSPVKEAKPLWVYIIDGSEWNRKPSIWYSITHLLMILISKANIVLPAMKNVDNVFFPQEKKR